MVKGVSRRVILVRSPDPKLFEQAIFIVREEAAGLGVSAEEVLAEARRVAGGYAKGQSAWGRLRKRLWPLVCAALGAAAVGAAWFLSTAGMLPM